MRITAHELAYAIEQKIAARLKSLRVQRAGTVAKELTPWLMDEVPTEAFDAKPSWEFGSLFFHGEVTEDYMLFMQEEILGAHYNIKPGLPITLYLSSIGGDFFAGMALHSTIQEVRRAKRKVKCHISGVAMSMGSIIAQACDERLIEPFAFMMIHEVTDGFDAKTLDAEDRLAFNKKIEATFCGMYAGRSGKPVSYWLEKIARKDVYMTAYEAVRLGLADRVVPVPRFAAPKKRNQPATAEKVEA